MTVQQVSMEAIFHEMGYTSSTDYAIKKMREELLGELKISLDAIDGFEKKYGMDFMKFRERFFSLTQFDLFEREDDSMDWSAELEEVRAIEKRLVKLI